MYDIAVIGLGPAGAVFCKYLKSGLKVIAIDKKTETPGGFCKPCGGLLAPDAQKSLSRFNMTLPKDILSSPQIFSVRTIDLKSGLIRHYQRFYINLDRDKLDRWLISQIPGDVEIRKNAVCTGITRVDGGFAAAFREDGEDKEIRAKCVVGADGANSAVRRFLFKDFKIREYLSIQQSFEDAHETPFYSCVFDPDITDSYAWGLTKDDRFIFGGAFRLKGAKKNFEKLKEKLRGYGFRLDNPVKTEACLVLRPYGINGFCTGKDGAFLIGEAAGFISPSSLEGISYAIDSGYILAGCFNSPKKNINREYRGKTAKIRFRLFLKTIKRPFMYNPLLRRIIMKTGISSISVLELDKPAENVYNHS